MTDSNRLMDHFFRIVRTDSISFKEKKLADFLGQTLSRLGFEVTVDKAGSKLDGDTGNVIARWNGKTGKPTLVFSAHMDTVEPGRSIEPVIRDGSVKSAGATVLGADDKAGVAAILELAHVLADGSLDSGEIYLIFTVAEEKGLLGAKNLELGGLKARYAYVIDGDGPVGGVVLKAPSQNSVTAFFKGKAAHAGVSPDEGVNSIQAAAHGIAKLKLGRIGKNASANIGVIRGGLAANIIPEDTVVEGEVRSFSTAKLASLTKQMKTALESGRDVGGATVTVKVDRAYDGFSFNRRNKIIKHVIAAMKETGVRPRPFTSGGGSDANILNKRGVPAVNLSVGVKGAHTVEEQVAVKDLEQLARLLPRIVAQAGR